MMFPVRDEGRSGSGGDAGREEGTGTGEPESDGSSSLMVIVKREKSGIDSDRRGSRSSSAESEGSSR